MLTRMRLEGFKSFADAEAPFGPLTLLVGANASGKTNALEAIRLVRSLVADIAPLRHALRHAGEIRGAREIARQGSDTFAIETSWRAESGRVFEHAITCTVSPELEVRAEELRAHNEPYWLRAKSLSAPVVDPISLSPSPGGLLEWSLTDNAAHPPASMAISMLYSAVTSVFLKLGDSPVRKMASELSDMLQGVRFLDITPSVMREYVPMEGTELDDDGENLSAILMRLCDDVEVRQGLVDWLSALCAPELTDLDFSKTDEGLVMLRLIERDGAKVSARSLSDGTLRFLGELVALRTAPRGSVILMEELGREVHPRRMHLLVEYLEALTEDRGIQVIATTHSPDVLAALGERARADTILLGRLPDQPGTSMRRLGSLPNFEEVANRRGLGDLFTMGWLEQAL